MSRSPHALYAAQEWITQLKIRLIHSSEGPLCALNLPKLFTMVPGICTYGMGLLYALINSSWKLAAISNGYRNCPFLIQCMHEMGLRSTSLSQPCMFTKFRPFRSVGGCVTSNSFICKVAAIPYDISHYMLICSS